MGELPCETTLSGDSGSGVCLTPSNVDGRRGRTLFSRDAFRGEVCSVDASWSTGFSNLGSIFVKYSIMSKHILELAHVELLK